MKIMVASDIHGDIVKCRDVIAKFNEEKADKLLLLGDLLYHGPRNDLPKDYAPKEVIKELNALKERIIAVRGNCDTEVDQMVIEFPIMAEYIYIVSGDVTIFATHGHHHNPDNLPFLAPGSIFLYGHTHVALDEMRGDIRIMNPGSPSIPKNGTAPSYIIIENGEAELKRLYA
ncbi:MAG: phosphodiesterase [Clostridiales bacterium]|nr:phosphodiesterase [Clostridiales bacterium]